ncbi:MAG: 4Fe-4S dicluster domain-containing protein [Clostridia bacterium]|jgi:formate dehydrogenase iron-sulfur subunit|nr:4Fe-4S dicluster domain-containing protein [Clostridia bacterium]
MSLSRRKFIKATGIAAAAFGLGGGIFRMPVASASGSKEAAGSNEAKGVLIDITKCIGCHMCSVACRKQNGLAGKSQVLDAETWTRVKTVEVDKDGEKVKRHIREQCFHCLDPACVSACLVGALEKTPAGPVIYDGSKCMGCRYCMIACPFNIPKYQWDNPFPLVRKCIFCFERLEEGKAPACVDACQQGATLFGPRSELLAEAERRIASHPGQYVEHIYGMEEVGGTSFLFLSDVPFEVLGFPTDLGTEPLPNHTWKALSKIPAVVLGGAAFLGAAYHLNKDRGEGK